MDRARITVVPKTPLLMHADNIDWADRMDEWRGDPDNKSKSKAGDDRTPPWRWIGCLNFDDFKTGVVTIPSEYIMRTLMEGAANVPTGKGQKTFKSQSQSGLICSEFHWPLLVNGKTIPMAEIQKLMPPKNVTFQQQKDAAEALGFSLFVKRVKIGASKHIRVRPRFDNWSVAGEIIITDEAISKKTLQQIFDQSGTYKGLGDWRPGCKTPGPWGTFKAEVE